MDQSGSIFLKGLFAKVVFENRESYILQCTSNLFEGGAQAHIASALKVSLECECCLRILDSYHVIAEDYASTCFEDCVVLRVVYK